MRQSSKQDRLSRHASTYVVMKTSRAWSWVIDVLQAPCSQAAPRRSDVARLNRCAMLGELASGRVVDVQRRYQLVMNIELDDYFGTGGSGLFGGAGRQVSIRLKRGSDVLRWLLTARQRWQRGSY